MNVPVSLLVARLHGHLVHRSGSGVFHVYSGPLTPSGRWVPRSGRTVCHQKTRRLSVIERAGVCLDLSGLRMCGRCTARLTSLSTRAVHPVSHDARVAFYAEVGLRDLVTAITLSRTVDETRVVGSVLLSLFDGIPSVRPLDVDHPRNRRRRMTPEQVFQVQRTQALFDVHDALNRRRRELEAENRTAEDRAVNHGIREDEAHDRRLSVAARRKAAARERAIERRRTGRYMTPYDKALADSA